MTEVEVKASASVYPHDFRGLSTFSEFAGTKFQQGILLYTEYRVLPFRIKDKTFHALPLSVLVSIAD